MCDVKPNPRCFTHYEPRYNDAKDAYQEALDDFESKEKAGTLTDEDYDNLAAAFEEYQACQRMYYMSPKARRHRHADEVAKVREALEEAKKLHEENPNSEYARLLYKNAQADLDQIQVQDEEGARRWEDAKRAGRLAHELNKNGLERGLFSQAQYTDEDLAEVNFDSWDRACPDGNMVLHNADGKLEKSNKRGVYREQVITSEKRLELPTGERLDYDQSVHIIQGKKASSSYRISVTIDVDPDKGLGGYIHNPTAHDGYYASGAPAERRPVTRDNSPSARDGGKMRSSDWRHTQDANGLTDEELAEQQEEFDTLYEASKADNDAHGRGTYTHVNTFKKTLNKTKKGERHNELTKWFIKEYNIKTSFNNIKDAQAEAVRILQIQDSLKREAIKNLRQQSINEYGKQQFDADNKRERDRAEKQARKEIEELPERLKPKSQSEIRNHGGGPDRVERNMQSMRRQDKVRKRKAKTAGEREASIDRGNKYTETLRKQTGDLTYSTHVESTRHPDDLTDPKAGYSYTVSNSGKGGVQHRGEIKFTKGGKLAKGYTKEDARDPRMVKITTPKGQTFTILRSQYRTMTKTGKKI